MPHDAYSITIQALKMTLENIIKQKVVNKNNSMIKNPFMCNLSIYVNNTPNTNTAR